MTAPYEPEYQELEAYRGLPWVLEINDVTDNGTTVDHTATVMAFTVRESKDDTSTALVTLTHSSGITRAATDPNIILSISDAAMTALAANEHAWYWFSIDNKPRMFGPFRIREWGAQ